MDLRVPNHGPWDGPKMDHLRVLVRVGTRVSGSGKREVFVTIGA